MDCCVWLLVNVRLGGYQTVLRLLAGRRPGLGPVSGPWGAAWRGRVRPDTAAAAAAAAMRSARRSDRTWSVVQHTWRQVT